MIVDSSAVLAVLYREPDAERYETAIAGPELPHVGRSMCWRHPSLWKAAAAKRRGMNVFLDKADPLTPVMAEHVEAARLAWRRFGKGNHRAALNFGDCFAYALAKTTDAAPVQGRGLRISSRHERKPRLQLPYLGGPCVLTAEDLNELVVELASRPGHEKVRVLLHRSLVGGLGANSQDIDFERPAPEVRGRIDALLGRTVFELKSDLRRERKDAEKGLTRYLSEREGQTGEKYVGIATDGADFIAFFLKNGSIGVCT